MSRLFKLRVQPVLAPTRIRNKAGTQIDEKLHQSRQRALAEALKYCQDYNCSAYTALSTGRFPCLLQTHYNSPFSPTSACKAVNHDAFFNTFRINLALTLESYLTSLDFFLSSVTCSVHSVHTLIYIIDTLSPWRSIQLSKAVLFSNPCHPHCHLWQSQCSSRL